MANSQSINTLVTTIRQRSNQVNSVTFDDTTELKPWIKQSLAQLYEILVSRWNNFYTVPRVLSLLQGQDAYSLPSDFRAMVNVYLLFNNGQYRQQLQLCTEEEYGKYGPQTVGTYGYWPFAYFIQRSTLFLTPAPQQDYYNAIEFQYVPQYSAPLLDYSPIDDVLPNGYEEWVVLDVLLKMNGKTRLLNGDDIARQKMDQEKRLVAAAAVRDGQAPIMKDIYLADQGSTWRYGTPSGPQTWAV